MFQDGQRLGEFEILGRLGQGGMGAVYKARQVSLNRFVALKTLQASLASDPEYIARFRREAMAAASLNHPNLVQVHSAGQTDGLHWFAMEYVAGESAQARVKRKDRLDAKEALAIAIHVATALEYGWRKAQLIHRDIKPDNIFLSSDGEVKLGDLGLAKSVNETQSLTMTGSAMGTPHYVSPEQAEGKKDVDLRADIYSLGCTVFHLLTGKPPYSGDTAMAVMMKHVNAPVANLRTAMPGCPEPLARAVTKMMAKQPASRQQTYADVIADLRRAYDSLTSATVPQVVAVTQQAQQPAPAARPAAKAATAPNRESKTENRKSKPALLTALAVIVAVLGIAAFFFFGKKQPPLSEAERAEKARAAKAAPSITSTPSTATGTKTSTTPTTATKAIKLWNTPVEFAKTTQAAWEGNVLKLINGEAFYDQKTRDIIFRASVRANPDSNNLQMQVRHGRPYYRLQISPSATQASLEAVHQTGAVRLGTWKLPRRYGPDEYVPLELRAIGDTLTVSAEGQVLGSVTNPGGPERGGVALYAAANGYFRDIEVVPLDGVASAPGAEPTAALKYAPGSIADLLTSPDYEWSQPENLGPNVNSARSEQAPSLPADGLEILFASNRDTPDNRPFSSRRKSVDEAFGPAVPLKEFDTIKTLGSPPKISADGLSLFFSASGPDDLGGGDIYQAHRRDRASAWGAIRNLGPPVSTSGHEGHPSPSPDGLALLFTSNRPGGQGGDDLWLSRRKTVEAPFETPVNLGGEINTVDNDWTPAWAGDSRAFLFFRVAKDAKTFRQWYLATWDADGSLKAQPFNLPPNIPNPEQLTLTPDGRTLYFTAMQMGGRGIWDLWQIHRVPKQKAADSSVPPAAATKDAPFINTLGMEFVPVPIGGGPTVGQRVLFGVWDVRVGDYAAYAAAQESAGKKVDGSWKTQHRDGVPAGREVDHPVVGVSWEDAQAFCQWLPEKETAEGKLPKGLKYRLPSDEEWSWAVGLPPELGATPEKKHGKNSVEFPWGKDWPPTKKVGNYADETFHAKFPKDTKDKGKDAPWIKDYTDGYATTSPVGSFPANAYGLYDMGGNVWQWCEDWFDKDQKDRVLRGASWYYYIDRGSLLSSLRGHPAPGARDLDYGFRCVLGESAR